MISIKYIFKHLTPIVFSSIFILACESPSTKTNNNDIKSIVCTTGMLGDAVENLVSNQIEVTTLMGPGVDPHLYKATQGDLKKLTEADIIVYNGLHLEGKMAEIFEKLKGRKKIIVATDGITEDQYINNSDFINGHDPHIWFDASLWAQAVQHISSEIIDYNKNTSLDSIIEFNTKDYSNQLEKLHQNALIQISDLAPEKRILITAHDAFGYFGRAYEFKVKGLQGISTTSEYGLKDISNLVNFIIENEIKAIFVESSVSPKSIEAVIEGCLEKGHQVKIGGKLYSDAIGEKNSETGTYLGMFQYNISTIVNNLK